MDYASVDRMVSSWNVEVKISKLVQSIQRDYVASTVIKALKFLTGFCSTQEKPEKPFGQKHLTVPRPSITWRKMTSLAGGLCLVEKSVCLMAGLDPEMSGWHSPYNGNLAFKTDKIKQHSSILERLVLFVSAFRCRRDVMPGLIIANTAAMLSWTYHPDLLLNGRLSIGGLWSVA